MGMLTNNQKQHKKTTTIELWEKPRIRQQLWELWKNLGRRKPWLWAYDHEEENDFGNFGKNHEK